MIFSPQKLQTFLQAIERVAWDEVTTKTIRNCFSKCGFDRKSYEDEDSVLDDESKALFNELSDSSMTAKEYITLISKHVHQFSKSTR